MSHETENEQVDRPNWLIAIIAAFVPLAALAQAIDLPRQFGFVLYKEQVLAAVLAASMALVFITTRAVKAAKGAPVPWYDWIAAAASVGTVGYLAYNYQTITFIMAYRPTYLVVLCAVLLLLLLEACRRCAGLGLTGVVAFFTIYAFWGYVLPPEIAAQQIGPDRLAIYLALDPNALLGSPLMIAVTIVTLFVLFGNWLTSAGGTIFFTDLATALMGRHRGGAAKVSVVGSMLFGSISGSAVANVMATGVVTIQTMIRSGFPRLKAGAVEAAASTGGQLAPPIMGAAAFLMAEFLQVPYGTIMLAAVIPALFYYFAIFVGVDLTAAREGIHGLDTSMLLKKSTVLRKGWFFVLPFAVLLCAIFILNERPERAVAYAGAVVIAVGILLGYNGHRMPIKGIWRAVVSAGMAGKDIVVICAAAGVVIGALNVSGIGFALTIQLVELGATSLLALLVIAALLCIILGMGMPSTGVYVLLAALVVPALIRSGVEPLSAHFFVFYFGMLSMISPPIALAAYAAASLTGEGPMRTAVAACALGWTAFVVPFLFVFSPSLLMQGNVAQIALAVMTGLGGIVMITGASVGFLIRRMGVLHRVISAVAGVLLLIDFSDVVMSITVNAAGAGVAAVLIVTERRAQHGAAPQPATDL
ncbi:TRAP transporter, 4TM/12TM fusion protein [Monaibacterium marinum]|uniref:TRAP transporter, 4TM/12TM fusion protein n=1 Tax=Pontivivens marinum TaxID=1690039 RepID=A0A2C9CUR9_9RHOB|nr:TRAP transporter fused permease subunit [Monaibacterium marinum]SOH94953.1 TRAP transporter, 4TM/12TM fusion protein [Monaibacterium marinum]